MWQDKGAGLQRVSPCATKIRSLILLDVLTSSTLGEKTVGVNVNALSCLSPGGPMIKRTAGTGLSPPVILSARQQSMVLLSESITVKKQTIDLLASHRFILQGRLGAWGGSIQCSFCSQGFCCQHSFYFFNNGVISVAVRDKKNFFVVK